MKFGGKCMYLFLQDDRPWNVLYHLLPDYFHILLENFHERQTIENILSPVV
jgi:hypothetical protein